MLTVFTFHRFMPADSLWTLCMACNVYLTFFKNRNAIELRKLEKWYFLFCYGFPLPAPLIYLILDHTKNRHGRRIFGPATVSADQCLSTALGISEMLICSDSCGAGSPLNGIGCV